ncbi:MAG: cytochrome C oxidase subunit II [Brevundimonas sp.]|nr:cytochrome C oxidase subunit II [Brevundimonas sp.]
MLSALLIYGLGLTSHLTQEPAPGEMRVRVTGEMWWWRVGYLDADGREVVRDANEVHIPVGRPVVFELESADVIHSFWVPRLGGKVDMIPGRRNLMRLQADAPGVYGGQCAEYCGGPHALMGLVVVAHEPADFEAWRARQAAPAATAALSQSRRRRLRPRRLRRPAIPSPGRRSTASPGRISAMSDRAAPSAPASCPTTRGPWPAGSPTARRSSPANRMPAYPVLTGQELRDVSAWLESLK